MHLGRQRRRERGARRDNAAVTTPAKQVDRLRVLVDAGIALSSELSLDALLQRLVETAAELTGARYAALGVIDKSGQSLERFLTTGVDAETHRGDRRAPARPRHPRRPDPRGEHAALHDLADDPRSVGFPPNHPSMRTFLGVPILLRGVAYGNLYLTEKAGGEDFSEEDEELTQLLAAQAAVAIENARLYESSDALAATARVAERDRARARLRARARAAARSSPAACASSSKPGSC